MPPLKILSAGEYAPLFRVLPMALQQTEEFQIFETSDGGEAVQRAKELQPDLILLDVGLPMLNGIEFAKRIRDLAPRAKLLFVSNESSSDMVQETFRVGVQGYVHKASVERDLPVAIEAVLDGKRFLSRSLERRKGTYALPYKEEFAPIAALDLRKTEEVRLRYAAIAESSDDAIISKDLNGVISAWNSAAQRIFGYTAAEAIGQSITIIIPPELRHEEEILRRLQAGQRIDHFETRRVSKDGRMIDVSITVSPLKDAEGRIVGASKIARNITQRKLAEAAISTMSQRLIEAQEEERRRVARELHDDISQQIFLLLASLQGLSVHSSLTETRKVIETVIQQAMSLESDVRALSHRLHSSNLEHLGLAAAVTGYCKEFSDQHNTEIQLCVENSPNHLSVDVSLCLFRVLQEALQNAIKHSGTRKFDVSLIGRAQEITLTINDSGTGFDYETAIRGRGLGLISMRERLKLVNGTVSIDTELGRGSTIRASVPFASKVS